MPPSAALSSDEFYTDIPVGEILRRARLQHGLTLRDAELHLHIRIQHLEALERSDFDALPGQVYVVGFIRAYAEFLGLDGGRVIHVLKRQSRGLGTPQSLNAHILPSDSRLPSVSMIAVASALFLLLLVFWIAYQSGSPRTPYMLPIVPNNVRGLDTLEYLTKEGGEATPLATVLKNSLAKPKQDVSQTGSPAAPLPPASLATGDSAIGPTPPLAGAEATVPSSSEVSGSPSGSAPGEAPNLGSVPASATASARDSASASAPTSPSVPEASGATVSVTLLDDSWIELRAPDGNVVSARLYKKGENFRLAKPIESAGRAYTMTVSNAAALEIKVGATTIPALGKAGEVRRNVSLDPKMLKLLLGAQ